MRLLATFLLATATAAALHAREQLPADRTPAQPAASAPAHGAVVIALPMKIEGGSGGPLRAVALVPR